MKVISSVPNSPKTRILLESKIDLEKQREVTLKQGKEIFNTYKFQGELIGTSSKTGENVENVFEMLGREILNNSLRKCSSCGRLYPLELKFCQYCGQRTE